MTANAPVADLSVLIGSEFERCCEADSVDCSRVAVWLLHWKKITCRCNSSDQQALCLICYEEWTSDIDAQVPEFLQKLMRYVCVICRGDLDLLRVERLRK